MPTDKSHGLCDQHDANPSNAPADTMTQDNRSRLQNIFREVFDDDRLTLADDTSRESLEAWDSLGHIRLISAMEEGLGVSFTLDEIENMASVAQILACLSSKS